MWFINSNRPGPPRALDLTPARQLSPFRNYNMLRLDSSHNQDRRPEADPVPSSHEAARRGAHEEPGWVRRCVGASQPTLIMTSDNNKDRRPGVAGGADGIEYAEG